MFFVVVKFEAGKGIVIKRKFVQLAHDVEAAAERSSKSRFSDQQTIMESFTVASSSALPSAIANLIDYHGFHLPVYKLLHFGSHACFVRSSVLNELASTVKIVIALHTLSLLRDSDFFLKTSDNTSANKGSSAC